MNRESRPEAAHWDLGGSALNSTGAGADAQVVAAFRGAYAVLVRGKTVRRHLYFSLPAAERVVKRAHARGDQADLMLVKLVPVVDQPGDRVLRRPADTDDMLRGLDEGGAL